jgi:type II secretory pathway component PulJ
MGNCRTRKKGFVLFTALIAVAVLSIISITVVTLVLNDSMQLNRAEARLNAHYRALSGVEIARALLEKDETKDARGIFRGALPENGNGSFELVEVWENGDNWESDLQTIRNIVLDVIQSSQSDIAFAILSNRSGSEFKIVSYGNRNKVVESFVLTLASSGGAYEFPIFDMAVFTDSYIELKGSARIEGKSGINSVSPGSINISGGGAEITGTIYVGVDGDTHVNPSVNPNNPNQTIYYPEAVVTRTNIWNNTWLNTHPIENLTKTRLYTLPAFPDPPASIGFPTFPVFPEGLYQNGNWNINGSSTLTVTQNGDYAKLSVAGSGRLIFDLGGKDLSIRANSLSVGGSGQIEVRGPGTLNLYVEGNTELGGNGVSLINSAGFNLYTNGNFSTSQGSNVKLSTVYAKGQTQLKGNLLDLENLYVDSNQSFSTSQNGIVRISSNSLVKASSVSLSSGTIDFQSGPKQQFEVSGTMSLSGNVIINGISKGVIRAGTLNIGQGHINLAEGGKLEVYASTDFDIGAGGTLNNGGEVDAVRVNYAGTNSLKLTGNIRFTGIAHIQRADIDVGGSAQINGLVISGGQTVNLTGDQLANVIAVYAPDSTVNMDGSALVRGAIVSDRLIATGSAKVVYETDIEETFPPELIGLVGGGQGEIDAEIWSR